MTSEMKNTAKTMTDRYQPRVSRRTTLAWLSATMAAGVTKAYAQGPLKTSAEAAETLESAMAAQWPQLDLAPITAPGYGKDPNLVSPTVPWPLTMTDRELQVASALGDMIIPKDEKSPAASAVGAPDFINEWVSAPYPSQQSDRALVIPGLHWIDAEAQARFGKGFVEASDEEKSAILDDIIGGSSDIADPGQAARFFGKFRSLISGGFYTTQEGMADVQYLGNTPIAGPYPGPSEEAMAHLDGLLAELGLELK